jgi:membrane protein implicated in regulation of membrane protease activity
VLTYWVVGGIALMLLEVIVPGMVLVFLGAAALIVAVSIWFGILAGWIPALTAWFVLSLGLLIVLRSLFQRLMPGDEGWSSTDEDADAYGQVVDVAETIPKGAKGRIYFRGTTWPATCYDHTVQAGSQAKLVYRDNVVWIVEALDHTPGETD